MLDFVSKHCVAGTVIPRCPLFSFSSVLVCFLRVLCPQTTLKMPHRDCNNAKMTVLMSVLTLVPERCCVPQGSGENALL